MPYTANYDAERYIGVNENSPLYEYNNGLGIGAIGIPGIYSKSEPFLHNGPGTAVFLTRNANVAFNAPSSNLVAADTISWVKCCEDYRNGWGVWRVASDIVQPLNANNFVKYYPNPVKSGKNLTILFEQPISSEPSHFKLNLFNMLGQMVSSVTNTSNESTLVYAIPENLPAGIYVLKVQYSGYTKTIRLTINN